MSGKRKQALLAEGLDILAVHGPNGLTIDALCTRLACTKGSFYHHFRNREQFVRDLLEYWIEEHTLRVIEKTDLERAAQGQMGFYLRLAWDVPREADNSIRAWALRDPLVESYVRRADSLRLQYLQNLMLPYVSGPAEALLFARIKYALYLGSRFICPPLSETEHRELAVTVSTALGFSEMLPPHDPNATDGQGDVS